MQTTNNEVKIIQKPSEGQLSPDLTEDFEARGSLKGSIGDFEGLHGSLTEAPESIAEAPLEAWLGP